MMYLRIEVRTVDLQFNKTIEQNYQYFNAIDIHTYISPEDSLQFGIVQIARDM
jgi:hypothetical protein